MSIPYHCFVINNIIFSKTDFIIIIPMIDHPNIRGKDEVKVGFLWGELGRKRKEAAE